MALSKDFYKELRIKDLELIEYANKGLLNIYNLDKFYVFYKDKQAELEIECSNSNNSLLSMVLAVIKNVTNFIEVNTMEYKKGKNITSNDLKKITDLLFTNIMENRVTTPVIVAKKNVVKEETEVSSELRREKLKKAILSSLKQINEYEDEDLPNYTK